MSGKIAPSLARLIRDRGGNFGLIAGLCALPLVFLVGGAVDIAIAQSRHTLIQNAADAAALAAAKQFAVDPDPAGLEKVARQFFTANTGELFRTRATLVFDGLAWTQSHSREVRLHVEYAYAPIFIPDVLSDVAGFGSKTADVKSAVLVSDTTVELALVLDTSGSMGYPPAMGGPTKIETLRTEAKDLVGSFFDGASTGADKPTQIAIVPFSGAVNVGPDNLDAAWMDPDGLSPAHHENFLWQTYTDAGRKALSVPNADGSYSLASDPKTKLTRQYIYETAKGSNNDPLFDFRGCVETRLGSSGITDAAPDKARPETLFVPWFAPDERAIAYYNNYLNDNAGPAIGATLQGSMNKYFHSPKLLGGGYSPGENCDSVPLLPLQSTKAPLEAKIDGLRAEGYTNVEEGVAWGWRVLSSREPFTEGRALGDPKNIKAIVVMTDGENTYNSRSDENRSEYGSHGYSAKEHIFEETSQPKVHTNQNFTLAMEARTRKVCENAKADGRRAMLDASGRQLVDAKGPVMSDGVVIYTIAFDIPAGIAPRIKQVLTDCASYKTPDLRKTDLPYATKEKYYYKVGDKEQLKAAFADIKASLTKMRISE